MHCHVACHLGKANTRSSYEDRNISDQSGKLLVFDTHYPQSSLQGSKQVTELFDVKNKTLCRTDFLPGVNCDLDCLGDPNVVVTTQWERNVWDSASL